LGLKILLARGFDRQEECVYPLSDKGRFERPGQRQAQMHLSTCQFK